MDGLYVNTNPLSGPGTAGEGGVDAPQGVRESKLRNPSEGSGKKVWLAVVRAMLYENRQLDNPTPE